MNYVVLFCALLIPVVLFSQEEADTVVLDELTISGNLFQRFSNGSGYKKISIAESASTLEQALADQSSIYFRTYGNQQLSTISFRGTSASQTNVLWHGIPANYPTLGQMDFSQWPAWFMDDIALEPGSGGALYGSGSIGGTVLVDSDIPHIEPGIEAKVGFGSFGSEFYGVKGGYKVDRLLGQSDFFYSDLDNDFPYRLNGEKFRQRNAGVENVGFQQKLVIPLNRHKILLVMQMSGNDREIQPSKASPENSDLLQTLNLREIVVDQVEWKDASLTSTLAFLANDQEFNRIERTSSVQISLASNFWKQLTKRAAIRVGVNANRYTAESDNYPKKFVDYQSSVFGSLEYKFFPGWVATLNLRQSFYKTNAPFTPSIGTSYLLLNKEKHELKMRGSAGFGFRFPTLNDLYWRSWGNPDLVPEQSFSIEGGGEFTRTAKSVTTFSITGYRTWSRDWITWIPSGLYFSPTNYRNVELKGLETSLSLAQNGPRLSEKLTLSYSYNSSQTTLNSEDKQMPYTPFHLASGSGTISLNRISITGRGSYTSRRYVTLNNTVSQSVAGFALFDLLVYGKLEWGTVEIVPSFQVLNVLNTSYENLLNRAMPGRNYQVSLSIKL